VPHYAGTVGHSTDRVLTFASGPTALISGIDRGAFDRKLRPNDGTYNTDGVRYQHATRDRTERSPRRSRHSHRRSTHLGQKRLAENLVHPIEVERMFPHLANPTIA
jgi:hypothetical protein